MCPRIAVPKCNWAHVVLPDLLDQRFRSHVRMDRTSFLQILHCIEDDPVFVNSSNNKQAPVYAQLHYALSKLGHDGNASGYMKTASTLILSSHGLKKGIELQRVWSTAHGKDL